MRDDLLHFTIEVAGKPIAVITHTDLEGARQLADENADEFAYLGAFEYGADLSVRLARGEECERWHAAIQAELEEVHRKASFPLMKIERPTRCSLSRSPTPPTSMSTRKGTTGHSARADA